MRPGGLSGWGVGDGEAAVYAAAYVSYADLGHVPPYGLICAAHAYAADHVTDWRERTSEHREREIREDADQA